MSKHVIIAGPGRVGSTLLMQTLTDLGFNTGFKKNLKTTFAGGQRYEWKMRGEKLIEPFPYILKEPAMCADIDLRIERFKMQVDHIYIMLRKPGPIAPTLDFIAKGKPRTGTWEENLQLRKVEKVERGFSRRITQLIHLVAEIDFPHTLVSFPRWAEDMDYAYSKFNFLMKQKNISREEMKRSMEKFIRKEELEKVKANIPEWVRASMREWVS